MLTGTHTRLHICTQTYYIHKSVHTSKHSNMLTYMHKHRHKRTFENICANLPTHAKHMQTETWKYIRKTHKHAHTHTNTHSHTHTIRWTSQIHTLTHTCHITNRWRQGGSESSCLVLWGRLLWVVSQTSKISKPISMPIENSLSPPPPPMSFSLSLSFPLSLSLSHSLTLSLSRYLSLSLSLHTMCVQDLYHVHYTRLVRQGPPRSETSWGLTV